MKNISIDDDVYKYLQRKAIAYTEEPNDTLRRLFSLNDKTPIVGRHITNYIRRKPRTSLRTLKNEGIITEGQVLHFRDYRDNPVQDISAVIIGEKLLYKKEVLSMSEHAVYILNDIGYNAKDVRGPQFWYTDDGKSIMQLWNEYLERNNRK